MSTLLRLFRSLWAPLIAAALIAMLSTPLQAEDAKSDAVLDGLFEQLRVAPDEFSAHRIDQAIWAVWTNPSDPALNSRMQEVLAARSVGDIVEAVRLLDELVVDYPDYAEGWNQRATMHYMLGNFDLSLSDCAKVLELEPRHFGALSGRALIYLAQGKRALALKDMAAALAVHPFLAERQLFPELGRPPATQI